MAGRRRKVRSFGCRVPPSGHAQRQVLRIRRRQARGKAARLRSACMRCVSTIDDGWSIGAMRDNRRRLGRSRKISRCTCFAPIVALFFGMVAGRAVHAEPINPSPRMAVGSGAATDMRLAKADREFEAVALHALLAPMFSSDRSGAHGAGIAGKHWQALLSEHIAKQIASNGQLRLRPSRQTAQGREPKVSTTHGALRASARDCDKQGCAPSINWTTVVESARDGARAQAGSSGWELRNIDAVTAP